MDLHPATVKVLSYFECEHLKDRSLVLYETSKLYRDLAHTLADRLPPVPKTTDALNALLRSKDDAVRAALDLLNDAEAEKVSYKRVG